MKNVVKFSSDFFPYFEALYTNSADQPIKLLFACNLTKCYTVSTMYYIDVNRTAVYFYVL